MRTARWILALAMVIGLWVPGTPAAEARRGSAPVLDRPTATASKVVLSGRARPRSVVRIQVRGAGRWVTVRSVRAARTGRYRSLVPRAQHARSYRAVSQRRSSVVRRVGPRPAPPAPPTPPAPPAPVDACGERPAKAGGGYWSCTFSDDFEGTSLDTSKWLVQETSYSGMTSGHKDCYVDGESSVVVGSGELRMTARRNLEPFTCASPYGDFETRSTASGMATRDRFSQVYGRFAFRARFPAREPGSHSALWLYPERHYYGAWPLSGEIDVAEWFGALPEKVYPSVHYAGEQPPLSSGLDCPVATASTAFHTYVVEWTPTLMRFSYDGRVCFEHAWTPTNVTGSAPFDRPFNLVLSQAWGSLWNAPTAQTSGASTLVVDWVRAWQ